jgi:preprotein translocase subunit SecE
VPEGAPRFRWAAQARCRSGGPAARHGTTADTQDSKEEVEVAERNRRGEDAADEQPDEVFDDAFDDDTPAASPGGGGMAVKERPPRRGSDRSGLFGRIGRFVREVVAELRKVIWPTRKELVTYTAVVVVFITFLTAVIVVLDLIFARGVLWVFGNPE